MPILKFTKEKPSAIKVWNAITSANIAPREGHTKESIEYCIFLVLQLSEDFRGVLLDCNKVIDTPTASLDSILKYAITVTGCSVATLRDLRILSHDYPSWLDEELYVPYYFTKEVCHKNSSTTLLATAFDREELSLVETEHYVVDSGSSAGLTAYKIYNNTAANTLLKYITISYDRSPTYVSTNEDLLTSIKHSLVESTKVSTNNIIPEGAKTTIPYFKVGVTSAP